MPTELEWKRRLKIMEECLENYRLEAFHTQLALTREKRLHEETKAELATLKAAKRKRP